MIYYWDARPGVFVDKYTGTMFPAPPDYCGPYSSWLRSLHHLIREVLNLHLHQDPHLIRFPINFVSYEDIRRYGLTTFPTTNNHVEISGYGWTVFIEIQNSWYNTDYELEKEFRCFQEIVKEILTAV